MVINVDQLVAMCVRMHSLWDAVGLVLSEFLPWRFVLPLVSEQACYHTQKGQEEQRLPNVISGRSAPHPSQFYCIFLFFVRGERQAC